MNLDTENMDLFEISMQNAILQGRIVKYVSDEGETLYKLSPQN